LYKGADSTWEKAVSAITAAFTKAASRIGVIASTRQTNEELFLIRELFKGSLGAQVTASIERPPGYSDDFLIKADKNPNTLGAALLGLTGDMAPDAASIVDAALEGRIDALWVFGLDLVKTFGDEKVQELARKLDLFVYSGTNDNATAAAAHWTLPTAAYIEKDGTFVNVHGRVQRIGRAFLPLADSREDWKLLLEIARQLDHPLNWRNPKEIFLAMAESVAPFAGLTYKEIGPEGSQLGLNVGPGSSRAEGHEGAGAAQ
jgi:NADH-quinone oxidoreductase subunit G